MSIICQDCGFENDDNEKFCIQCGAELLVKNEEAITNEIISEPVIETSYEATKTVSQAYIVEQITKQEVKTDNGNKKHYVMCKDSDSKTYVDGPMVTSFYCKGCNEEHPIDGFFWEIEEEAGTDFKINDEEIKKEVKDISNENEIKEEMVEEPKEKILILEDVATHHKFEILPPGGTFGRYGDYGASFLQTDSRGAVVSGVHCRFSYGYGRWTLEHLSNTNDTVYDGRKLEHGFEEALREGKTITLANSISFLVRIK